MTDASIELTPNAYTGIKEWCKGMIETELSLQIILSWKDFWRFLDPIYKQMVSLSKALKTYFHREIFGINKSKSLRPIQVNKEQLNPVSTVATNPSPHPTAQNVEFTIMGVPIRVGSNATGKNDRSQQENVGMQAIEQSSNRIEHINEKGADLNDKIPMNITILCMQFSDLANEINGLNKKFTSMTETANMYFDIDGTDIKDFIKQAANDVESKFTYLKYLIYVNSTAIVKCGKALALSTVAVAKFGWEFSGYNVGMWSILSAGTIGILNFIGGHPFISCLIAVSVGVGGKFAWENERLRGHIKNQQVKLGNWLESTYDTFYNTISRGPKDLGNSLLSYYNSWTGDSARYYVNYVAESSRTTLGSTN